MGSPVFGHDVGALPVVDQDIRHVMALLEQVAASGKVIRPILRIISPGLVPAEPLAEDQQAQAGLQLVRRLMGAFVDEKAVETAEQRQVGGDLQVAGIPAVGVPVHAIGRKSFAGDDVLPVEMGHGGGLPYICRVDDLRMGIGGPDGRHRDGGAALDVHAVTDESAAGFVAFGVSSGHAVFPEDVVHAVVIGSEKLPECFPPVKEESLGLFRTAEDFSGQGRQPGPELITSGVAEYLFHAGRPGHPFGFIAVNHQVADALGPQHAVRGVFVQVQILMEIPVPGVRIELVDFQARSFGRSGMVLLACEGSAETVDAPATGRHIPDQRSVGTEQRGQVNGLRNGGM